MYNATRPSFDNTNVDNIEELIKQGKLSSMTECAMGGAVADDEANHTLNKNDQ